MTSLASAEVVRKTTGVSEPVEELEAVKARHPDIEEHEIWPELARRELAQSMVGRVRGVGRSDVRMTPQDIEDQARVGQVVFDDEDIDAPRAPLRARCTARLGRKGRPCVRVWQVFRKHWVDPAHLSTGDITTMINI
jgi:hypothetical protein